MPLPGAMDPALAQAARQGDTASLGQLLAAGVDPNAAPDGENSALCLAAMSGHACGECALFDCACRTR